MTIKHHLSGPILMGFSAGTLPEAFNLVVATHISMCDDCRAELASYEALGGTVLDRCECVAMKAGALSTTMQLIGAQDNTADAPKQPRPGVFPGPLQDYVGGDLADVKWRPVGGGIRQAILPTSRQASVRLLRIPAGTSVPDHGHCGQELTLVLQGAFQDETDRFGPGDVEIAGPSLTHAPVAEAGVDCICLAATDAPLRFRSLLARIAQPFLRT